MPAIKGFKIGNNAYDYQDPNLAAEFSTEATYKIGDLIFNDGKLYRCLNNITTAGAWNSNDWFETKVQDYLSVVSDEYGSTYPNVQAMVDNLKAAEETPIYKYSFYDLVPYSYSYANGNITFVTGRSSTINHPIPFDLSLTLRMTDNDKGIYLIFGYKKEGIFYPIQTCSRFFGTSFSESTSYVKGDYVRRTGATLYECKENISAGPWDDSDWNENPSVIQKTFNLYPYKTEAKYICDLPDNTEHNCYIAFSSGGLITNHKLPFECSIRSPICKLKKARVLTFTNEHSNLDRFKKLESASNPHRYKTNGDPDPGLIDYYSTYIPDTAPEFSAEKTYSIGTYVMYDGVIYKCIDAITTAGEWTGATNWEELPPHQRITKPGGGQLRAGVKYIYANGFALDAKFYKLVLVDTVASQTTGQINRTFRYDEIPWVDGSTQYNIGDMTLSIRQYPNNTVQYPRLIEIPPEATYFDINVYAANNPQWLTVLDPEIIEFLPEIAFYGNYTTDNVPNSNIGRAIYNALTLLNFTYPTNGLNMRYFNVNNYTQGKTINGGGAGWLYPNITDVSKVTPTFSGIPYGTGTSVGLSGSIYTFLSAFRLKNYGVNNVNYTGKNTFYGLVCVAFVSLLLGLPMLEGTEWWVQKYLDIAEEVKDNSFVWNVGDISIKQRYNRTNPSLYTHACFIIDKLYDVETGEFGGYVVAESANTWVRISTVSNMTHSSSTDTYIEKVWRIPFPFTSLPPRVDQNYRFKIDVEKDPLNNPYNLDLPPAVLRMGDMTLAQRKDDTDPDQDGFSSSFNDLNYINSSNHHITIAYTKDYAFAQLFSKTVGSDEPYETYNGLFRIKSTPNFSNIQSYIYGDLVSSDSKIYECIKEGGITADEDHPYTWDNDDWEDVSAITTTANDIYTDNSNWNSFDLGASLETDENNKLVPKDYQIKLTNDSGLQTGSSINYSTPCSFRIFGWPKAKSNVTKSKQVIQPSPRFNGKVIFDMDVPNYFVDTWLRVIPEPRTLPDGSRLPYANYMYIHKHELLDSCKSSTLCIKTNGNTGGNNGHYYRCLIIKDNRSVISDAAKLEVGDELSIISPISTTVKPGQKATFIVQTNTDNATYQWQQCSDYDADNPDENVWTNIEGQTTDMLQVKANGTVDVNGYGYRCNVTYNGDTTPSGSAMLSIYTDIGFITQPIDTTAEPGTKAYFSVEPTIDDVTYQWKVSSDGTAWSTIIDNDTATKRTLCVIADNYSSSRNNGYKYRCTIGREVDGNIQTIDSNFATLTVGTLSEQNITTTTDNNLAIITQPSEVSLLTNSDAIFTVKVNQENVQYQWQECSNYSADNPTQNTWTNIESTNALSLPDGYQFISAIMWLDNEYGHISKRFTSDYIGQDNPIEIFYYDNSGIPDDPEPDEPDNTSSDEPNEISPDENI